LLDAGAKVDARGEHGYTPLHEAVEQAHIEAVRLLMLRGASQSVQNNWGQTPKEKAELEGNPEIQALFCE
jgi:ankyrin repeat protein